MKNLRGKIVVITGAASGLGRVLALKFAKKGARLALCDINYRDLERVSWDVQVLGAEVFFQSVDVSSYHEMREFRAKIIEKFGAVDVVINNAGVPFSQSLLKSDPRETKWLFDVNVFGVINSSQIFLGDLLLRKEARLVNISSIFSVLGIPNQTAYCASKYAVRGFTESLQSELKGTSVKVISVLPGGISPAGIQGDENSFSGPGRPTNAGFESEALGGFALVTKEQAADAILKAVQKPHERLVIGKDAWLLDLMSRIFPAMTTRWISIIASRNKKKIESNSSRPISKPTDRNQEAV